MLSQRRTLVPVIAGVAAGVFVAMVIWVYLFAQFEVFAPPRYPTFEAARPVAVEETGKYRWPGSSIRLRQVDAQRFIVERRWLGLRESVVRVEQKTSAWSVAEPEPGPGRAVQVVLACLVPGAALSWFVTRSLGRRSAAKGERSGSEPVETRR